MSKKDLYKNPSYMSKHPNDDPIRDAVVLGEAAAYTGVEFHEIPSNFPTAPTMAAGDFEELYRQENIFVAIYRRINRKIHGGE